LQHIAKATDYMPSTDIIVDVPLCNVRWGDIEVQRASILKDDRNFELAGMTTVHSGMSCDSVGWLVH
jgi:hypothetical protein